MKASALNLQAYDAKIFPADGHWLIHLASGKSLPLPVDPQPLADSYQLGDFNDAADSSAGLAIQIVAGLDQSVTKTGRNNLLSELGKVDALAEQRKAAVISTATAWKGVQKQAAAVAARKAILYGVPPAPAGDTVDREIRDWLRGMDVKGVCAYLETLVNGGRDAKAERVVEAVLRSPIPIGVGVIENVVNAIWVNVIADRQPAIVASVQAAEQNVAFAERVVTTCAAQVRTLSNMNELQLYKSVRESGGCQVYNIDKQRAAMLDRQIDALAA